MRTKGAAKKKKGLYDWSERAHVCAVRNFLVRPRPRALLPLGKAYPGRARASRARVNRSSIHPGIQGEQLALIRTAWHDNCCNMVILFDNPP